MCVRVSVCVLGTVPHWGWLSVLQLPGRAVPSSAGKGAPVPVVPSGLATDLSCCPQGPVPTELVTWGKRLGDPSPLLALLPLQRRWAGPPWGQPKLTRTSLCHGDGGRLLWQ